MPHPTLLESPRLRLTALAVLLGAVGFAATGILPAAPPPSRAERYLFVWAGDQARKAPDFLATVDFDEQSPNYGRVLATVPVPGAGASGNEPHHVGLSDDGTVLAAGGLLSVLKGQPEIFLFDVSNPLAPAFKASIPGLQGLDRSAAFLDHGRVLSPARRRLSRDHDGRAEGPSSRTRGRDHPRPADRGRAPGHPARPRLQPARHRGPTGPEPDGHERLRLPLDHPPERAGRSGLAGSVRVWNFRKRAIVRTIEIPGAAGTIDVQFIPGDREGRAVTAGMGDGRLYLVDTRRGAAQAVFDFNRIAPEGWPQLMRLTRDGRSLFVTMNRAGRVARLDVSRPDRPRLVQALDLGADAGPHYLALTRDERRLVVTDYFLNEDEAGKVHAEGDHKVHAIRVDRGRLELDRRFQLDFDHAFGAGAARPHGAAMK